jgi:hypothetical protein
MKKAISLSSNFLANQFHLLCIIISSFICHPAMAQDSSRIAYLQQHKETISTGGSNSFVIFDEAFYSHQVFLVSESHGYYKPHEVDFELFKQINKKTGVRYYLAEMDFSQAHCLNQYLNTGNEDFLKSIYQYWYSREMQWGCKAGFEKWQKMYAYNKTLPAGKKITVLGLDETQDMNMNVQLLNELVKKAGCKKGKDTYTDSLALFANINLTDDSSRRQFIRFTRRMDSAMNGNAAAYKKILKANYFDVQYIIRNTASKKGREIKIFENFSTYLNRYQMADEKMYGFWGRFHAMQDSVNGSMPFAGMLKKSNLSLKNKIVSIPVFCLESASMIPTKFLPPMVQEKGTVYSKSAMVNDDSFVYQVAGIAAFKSLAEKNGTCIFKLDAAGSPYFKGLDLLESKSGMDKSFEWSGNKNSATTSYFQYAVIVSNSDWAVPYGDNVAK